MAKAKGRPKTSERDDLSVKVDRAIASKAKLVATSQGKSLAEVISEMLRGPVDEAFARLVQDMSARSQPTPGRRKRGDE